MEKPTYALKLFHLLQEYRRKAVPKDDGLNAAKGIMFAVIIAIALWCIMISIGIVIF